MLKNDDRRTRETTINVGMYGCTKAGKTRFLRGLFHAWEQARRVRESSGNYASFMKAVDDELEELGDVSRTKATSDDIWVRVSRDGHDLPTKYEFRDLRGEELAKNIDALLASDKNGRPSMQNADYITPQVQKCDAFLFYFDPTSSEKPADIDAHHDREMRRAEVFIDYLLQNRQNDFLPVIFVQTHLDLWEADPAMQARSQQWFDDVNAKLKTLYEKRLHRHFPSCLIEKAKTSISVSSIRPSEVVKVPEKVHELVQGVNRFLSEDRSRSRRAIIGAVLFICVVFFGLFLSTQNEQHAGSSSDDPPSIPRTEAEIVTLLDNAEQLISSHPRGSRLPTIDEARKINQHLRWLSLKMESPPNSSQPLSDTTNQRMQKVMAQASAAVATKANSKGLHAGELNPVLLAYLTDLQDVSMVAPELSQAQSLYWSLQREEVVAQLAAVIKRRDSVASPPLDTLAEVRSELLRLELEITHKKVFGPGLKQKLLEETRTAATLCADLIKAKTYRMTMRVANATFKAERKPDQWGRNLTIHSPHFQDDKSTGGIGLDPSPKADTELSFTTRQPNYRITLGLGKPVMTILSLYNDPEKQWQELKRFDLTPDAENGPLAPLGLPMLRLGRSDIVKELRWEGYELKLEFSALPPIPTLIWDAATFSSEMKP